MSASKREAFERVALPAAAALYRTALRLTGRSEDASDVVQETFLRAYRTFGNFKAGTNAKAWLFTILYSILTNRWRRERHFHEVPLEDDVDRRFREAVASDAGVTERELIRRLDTSPEIETALASLPAEYRAAVVLVDIEELTYEEAAAALGCPVGTVRSRLARGRKLLFMSLRDYALRIGALKEEL